MHKHIFEHQQTAPPTAPHKLAALTHRQKALIFHYALTDLGIKLRDTTHLTKVAKFMHLVLGIHFTSIDRSSLYKSLRTIPNFTPPKALIKDLERIQPFFAQAKWSEILERIAHDVALAKRAQPTE